MTRLLSARPKALVALGAVAALALVSVAAPAADAGKPKKKKVERTVEKTYVGFTGVRGLQDSPCAAEPVGCIQVPVEKGERFISIEVTDASGGDVWASVYVYGYSDGTDVHEHVCGRSDAPLAIADGLEEVVVVITQTTSGATNPCDGAATQGTVTSILSNLP